MRKEEFLTALRAGLTGLSPEGVEKLVEFCSEMIDDRMEDGLTEEEAVAAAGSLDELIQQAKTELLPVKTANFPEKIHLWRHPAHLYGREQHLRCSRRLRPGRFHPPAL